ncbi:hypothetical protein ACLQ3C_10255 [Gordonia sp. DT30]|uniref:hypothetical protein n=1 Tax=unclassified Gordonia (in: high G+C Gram-positive bacteria) TaxID=2657482 RepID=UPI003CEEF819
MTGTPDHRPDTDEARAARDTVDDLERKITHNPAEDDEPVVDPASTSDQPGSDDPHSPNAGHAEPTD